MSATVIQFETRAQIEDRLFQNAMSAFDTYGASHTRESLEALVRALDRLVAAQEARVKPRLPVWALPQGLDLR